MNWTEQELAAHLAKFPPKARDIVAVAPEPKPAKRQKYGNRKTEVDGIVFDSAYEARCWQDLKLREAAGEISDLKRQVHCDIHVNGQFVCSYVADFVFMERGARVVADAKGCKTEVYKLKKKLMLACNGIAIVEL